MPAQTPPRRATVVPTAAHVDAVLTAFDAIRVVGLGDAVDSGFATGRPDADLARLVDDYVAQAGTALVTAAYLRDLMHRRAAAMTDDGIIPPDVAADRNPVRRPLAMTADTGAISADDATRYLSWTVPAIPDTDPTVPMTVVIGAATDASPYTPYEQNGRGPASVVATIDDPALGARYVVDFLSPPRVDNAQEDTAAILRALADAIDAGAIR